MMTWRTTQNADDWVHEYRAEMRRENTRAFPAWFCGVCLVVGMLIGLVA